MRFAPGYRILKLMRRGGAVDVFDAWSDERRCRCIVKLMRRSREHERRARRQLRTEAKVLLSLSHPHIVRAYELLERPRMALVLETLPGETLSRMLKRARRRTGARDLARFGLQICSALRYLHGKGVLHLDVKPSNIIVHGGIAKIIDLGLARRPGQGEAGIGTACYLAPEQARGGMVTPATDVFGLGTVFYQVATGKLAFQSNGDKNRYEQLERRADPVGKHRRLPDPLPQAIDGCLDPDPARRPSVDALMRDLGRLLRS